MPDAIVKDEKDIPVKFHPHVTHLIFECNLCHKEFSKHKSYFEKQKKTRKSACAFCSSKCRLKYYSANNNPESKEGVKPTKNTHKENNSFISLIKNIFSS
jgi:anaerobic selenocysteine-containing dehydrogenase